MGSVAEEGWFSDYRLEDCGWRLGLLLWRWFVVILQQGKCVDHDYDAPYPYYHLIFLI
jgi:hypothetical protein